MNSELKQCIWSTELISSLLNLTISFVTLCEIYYVQIGGDDSCDDNLWFILGAFQIDVAKRGRGK
jgi:hypothetical protein